MAKKKPETCRPPKLTMANHIKQLRLINRLRVALDDTKLANRHLTQVNKQLTKTIDKLEAELQRQYALATSYAVRCESLIEQIEVLEESGRGDE